MGENYDQFTCHTEQDNHILYSAQIDTPATDLHQIDTSRKLQNITVQTIEFLESEIQEEKEYLILQNKLRKDISSNLQLHLFKQLDLKNKDIGNPIHQLFKWIMIIFYKADSKFYDWNQFKQLCFYEDNGLDLQNRLGLVNVVRITKLEAELTRDLIKVKYSIDQFLIDKPTLKQQITMIFDIISLVLKTFEAGQKVIKMEEEICKRQIYIKKQKQAD